MLGFDATSGAALPPVWVAGAVAAVVAAGAGLLVVAGWRGGAGRRVLAGLAVVAALGLAAWTAELAATAQVRRAERHALATRLAELTGRALVPGSPLACLDGLAGTAAEPACEAVLLGRPETTAAAVAYVATQLALLGEAAPAADRDPALAAVLAPLRRTLAADRFGVVAHVLAQRAGCTPDSCAALALLDETERVRANIRDHRFELLLARNVAAWPGGSGLAAGDALTGSAAASQSFSPPLGPAPALAGTGSPAGAPAPASGPAAAGASGRPASARYDFPSAASIPPVSIM
ncbi:MAG: hypothetical protein HZA68_04145, partial [Rhodovulum sp.]|nr:hypothetical protein [Rhodovulum sp.]